MLNDQFWLFLYKTLNEYVPHIEENATNDEKLEFSILLLLIDLKVQNINITENTSNEHQDHQKYSEILQEINQTIENNQNQFNQLFDLVKK